MGRASDFGPARLGTYTLVSHRPAPTLARDGSFDFGGHAGLHSQILRADISGGEGRLSLYVWRDVVSADGMLVPWKQTPR